MFPRIGYMAQRGDVLLACVTAVSEVGGGVSVGQELVADGMGKHGGQFRIGERLRAKAFRWIVGGRQSVALPGAGYPLQLRRSMTSPRNQCHGAAHLVPGTGCCGLARDSRQGIDESCLDRGFRCRQRDQCAHDVGLAERSPTGLLTQADQ